MATIYKRIKGRTEPYIIQYLDHQGRRRTVKGYTDKGLTQELAAKLETEARLRTSGMVDPVHDRIAEQRSVEIEVHLKAFEKSISDNTPKYVKLTMSRVRRIVNGCGIATLVAIGAEQVQEFLRSLRTKEGIGHRTYNHYLQAFDTFCNWCVTTKRLVCNPILGLERLNTAVDVRHPRRALSVDEFSCLLDSARTSGKRIQGFSGEQRARIYTLSYMTGLRKKELASLTTRSFKLDASPPTVTVEAACSKHRRKDVLPLHPELVMQLPQWLKDVKPGQLLFPNLERRKTWLMVRKDLERVGIPYETEDGIADFHAAGRHTHITELLRNGTSLVDAKELARHSDVNMMMRYTHIGIDDQARAIGNLPTPKGRLEAVAHETHAEDSALQMRCIFCCAKGHPVTSNGSEPSVQKRQNPWPAKGSDANSRRLSFPGKVEAAGIEPDQSFPRHHCQSMPTRAKKCQNRLIHRGFRRYRYPHRPMTHCHSMPPNDYQRRAPRCQCAANEGFLMPVLCRPFRYVCTSS
jgi:site-specific recombinase XerD